MREVQTIKKKAYITAGTDALQCVLCQIGVFSPFGFQLSLCSEDRWSHGVMECQLACDSASSWHDMMAVTNYPTVVIMAGIPYWVRYSVLAVLIVFTDILLAFPTTTECVSFEQKILLFNNKKKHSLKEDKVSNSSHCAFCGAPWWKWLVLRFRSERLRVRSRRSATFHTVRKKAVFACLATDDK